MIFDPICAFFVDNGHELSLAVMLMLLIRPMIVVSPMIDYPHNTILSCRFEVRHVLKPKLMIDILLEQ